MQNNQFLTKSHVELDDNSNFSIPSFILLVVFQDIRWCKDLLSCPQKLLHDTKCPIRNQCMFAKEGSLTQEGVNGKSNPPPKGGGVVSLLWWNPLQS